MARREEYSVGTLEVDRIIGAGSPSGILFPTNGKRLYVKSTTGVANASGLSEATPMDSIVHAVAQCQNSKGDVIFCLPGHNETISAAAGLVLNKIGVTIVFLGNGTNKAKITFGTVVGADMNVSAAGIKMIWPKFVAAIDALTGPIDVGAADFEIIDAEWHDGATIDTTDCVVASTSATNIKIDGWKYVPGDEGGTQKQSMIQFEGAIANPTLRNININGNFQTSQIEATAAAATNVIFEKIALKNTNATGGSSPGMSLHANTTGWAKDVDIRIETGSTFVSNVGKINWDPSCLGYNADGEGGEFIGTQDVASIEGKIDVIDGYHDVPAQSATANVVIRDVIGNKTDPARNAISSTVSALSYLKGIVNEITVVAQSATANSFMNDVMGNKTDPARNALSSTYSVISYLKGLVNEVTVPAQSATANGFMNDVVGNKTDVAKNALSSTYSIVSYLKGLVNEVTVPAQSATDNAFMNDVIGNKTDVAKYTPAANLSAISYLKGLLNLQDGVTKDNSRYLSVAASLTNATWNATASHEILAVSGTNRIRIIPYVTADVDCSAGGLIKLGTSTSAGAFLGSTTGTGLDLGEYWFKKTAASNTKFPSYASIIDIITNMDVGYTLSSETSHGNIRFLCWYEPLETGASVAAGAGGTL